MIKFLNHAVLVLFFLAIIGNWSLTRSQPKKGPMKVPDFQRVAASKYGFSDTVELLKGAIEAQNLMVIKIIDAQRMLRLVGMKSKGMKQILFFHPRFMKSIIAINKNAAIEPPLKFAVMEAPNGKAMVKYIKPTYIFGKYYGLDELGAEFETLMETILNSVLK